VENPSDVRRSARCNHLKTASGFYDLDHVLSRREDMQSLLHWDYWIDTGTDVMEVYVIRVDS